MHAQATESGWIVRIDSGEDLVSTLLAFVRDHDIPSGEIRGIGTLREVELGYFDPEDKRHHRTTWPGSVELVSFLGNVAWTDEGPHLQAHAVIAGPDMVARGGRFVRGVVSTAGEFTVTPTNVRVRRALDPAVGLPLQVFPDEG